MGRTLLQAWFTPVDCSPWRLDCQTPDDECRYVHMCTCVIQENLFFAQWQGLACCTTASDFHFKMMHVPSKLQHCQCPCPFQGCKLRWACLLQLPCWLSVCLSDACWNRGRTCIVYRRDMSVNHWRAYHNCKWYDQLPCSQRKDHAITVITQSCEYNW